MKSNDSNLDGVRTKLDRRQFLAAGLAFAATAPVLTYADPATADAQDGASVAATPVTARAYGTASASAPLAAMQIQRRAVGPHDILLDVLYCGVCHSDVHTARNEWAPYVPTLYPCIPGHEIIGRVTAVGEAVTKFKAGDIGGVGCLVNSCRKCENCLDDREQNCLEGATLTFNSPELVSGGHTYGGYSDKLVVLEHFVIRIPPGADLAATAPLLCAGITTFSPMQHWHVKSGQKVGVIGFGGLGHMAVKLATARQADVTVFTTSPGKKADALRMGAKEVVLWNDEPAMKRLANNFHYLISTVPQAYPMRQFINLLKLDATMVNVGALGALEDVGGVGLIRGRKSLAGSLIGGIAETQEVIDFCAARNIKAEIELIRPDQINQAFDRVVNKDVRYRFVIDMKS
jgi:uncharacterized zinc-type alcohol dehydrogenase-like protein